MTRLRRSAFVCLVAASLAGCGAEDASGGGSGARPTDARLVVRPFAGSPARCFGLAVTALRNAGFLVAANQTGSGVFGTNGDNFGDVLCTPERFAFLNVAGERARTGRLIAQIDASFVAARDGKTLPESLETLPATSTDPVGSAMSTRSFTGDPGFCEDLARRTLSAAAFTVDAARRAPLLLGTEGDDLAEFGCDERAGLLYVNVTGPDSASLKDKMEAYLDASGGAAASPAP